MSSSISLASHIHGFFFPHKSRHLRVRLIGRKFKEKQGKSKMHRNEPKVRWENNGWFHLCSLSRTNSWGRTGRPARGNCQTAAQLRRGENFYRTEKKNYLGRRRPASLVLGKREPLLVDIATHPGPLASNLQLESFFFSQNPVCTCQGVESATPWQLLMPEKWKLRSCKIFFLFPFTLLPLFPLYFAAKSFSFSHLLFYLTTTARQHGTACTRVTWVAPILFVTIYF